MGLDLDLAWQPHTWSSVCVSSRILVSTGVSQLMVSDKKSSCDVVEWK